MQCAGRWPRIDPITPGKRGRVIDWLTTTWCMDRNPRGIFPPHQFGTALTWSHAASRHLFDPAPGCSAFRAEAFKHDSFELPVELGQLGGSAVFRR